MFHLVVIALLSFAKKCIFNSVIIFFIILLSTWLSFVGHFSEAVEV